MSLWNKEPFDYTEDEYNLAKEKVSKRLTLINDSYYFPIAKETLVPYTNDLILATIYGSRTTSKFKEKTIGYLDLIQDKTKEIKNNKIVGLDGRLLNVRAEHKVLNTLLQSGGAIYMKYVLVEVEKQFSSRWTLGKEYAYILNIHDAISLEIIPEIKQEVASLLPMAFLTASQQLNLARPVKGSPAFGLNQAETH